MCSLDELVPKWSILGEIPSNELQDVTGIFVYNDSNDLLVVANHNGDAKESRVYRTRILQSEHAVELEQLRGKQIVDIVASKSGTIFIPTSTELLSFGSNKFGLIGNGHASDDIVAEPYVVSGDHMKAVVTQISTGESHCACLVATGEVYTWGQNDAKQLGHNGANTFTPTLVEAECLKGQTIVQVACCARTTFALAKDGKLFGWGEGWQWPEVDKSPSEKFEFKNITQISCGLGHLIALNNVGDVYSCGSNEEGQLGLSMQDRVVCWPKRITAFDIPYTRITEVLTTHLSNATLAKAHDGAIYVWGPYRPLYHEPQVFREPFKIGSRSMQVALVEACYSLTTPVFLKLGRAKQIPLLDDLFDDPDIKDIIEVTIKDRTVAVHKTVLKRVSPYFRAMFSSECTENLDNKLKIEFTTFAVYKAFLVYCYTGELHADGLTLEETFELAGNIAEPYFLEDLKQKCYDHALEKWLNFEDVWQVYALGHKANSKLITKRCARFILSCLPVAVNCDQFENADPVLAKMILRKAVRKHSLKASYL